MRAVLLDAERVIIRAMARIAHDGFKLEPAAATKRWVAECIERAIE